MSLKAQGCDLLFLPSKPHNLFARQGSLFLLLFLRQFYKHGLVIPFWGFFPPQLFTPLPRLSTGLLRATRGTIFLAAGVFFRRPLEVGLPCSLPRNIGVSIAILNVRCTAQDPLETSTTGTIDYVNYKGDRFVWVITIVFWFDPVCKNFPPLL